MKKTISLILSILITFSFFDIVHAAENYRVFKHHSFKNSEEPLKPEELTLTLTAIDVDDLEETPTVRLYVDFNWNIDPFWTLTDSVKLSWSEGWNIKGYQFEVTHLYNDGTEKTKNYTASAQSPTELQWCFDLQKAADVYGRAVITLVPEDIKKLSAINFSSAKVQYIHEARVFAIKPINYIATQSVSWNNKNIID
jgi:hypothetical protein